MSETPNEYLDQLQRLVLSLAKSAVQRVPLEASFVVGEFKQGPQPSPGLVIAKKSKQRYYSVPNKTKKLRSIYGNIDRAITPGDKGNISNVTIEGGRIIVEMGIDTSVTVQSGNYSKSLAYAVINEKTRPYMTPGLALYNKRDFPKLMDDLVTDLLDAL